MSQDKTEVKVAVQKWQLIKWEGDPPLETEDPEIAKQHPACLEIIEGSDFGPTTVIYKRTA